MNITIATNELKAALSRAQGITNGKSGTLPILSTVLLEAEQTPEGGRLTVRAYDLELGLCSHHACEIKEPGAVAVPAKALYEIAKALSEMTVKLKSTANNRLEITSGSSSFKLAGQNAADFPAMPAPEAQAYQQMERQPFKLALDSVMFAMSSDETRYNLNGVYAEATPCGLDLVATDGHRMALYKLDCDKHFGLKPNKGAIISRKAVTELRKLMAEETAAPAELAFAESGLTYRRQGLTFTARLVDGSFPAYGQVIPKESKTPVFASRGGLSEVLKRVLLMASDSHAAALVKLEDGKLTISARDAEMGEATDQLPVEYAGEAVEIALNGRYIVDMLAATDEAKMVLSVTGDSDPVIVRPAGNENHLYVLMPVRK